MGIFCEINLFKPPGEVYRPGEVVAGVIKYTINEPMEVERITTSLKGIGIISLTAGARTKDAQTFITEQQYIDIDTIIQDTRMQISPGSYEVRFNYILRRNIPSSFRFNKFFNLNEVKCCIAYYVRIKFERPGFFAFNKHFRKEIHVISDIYPKLSREPVIYGESKKLMHLFSSKDSIVNIKATIKDSVLRFGGEVEINYEVANTSHVSIKGITTKLMQLYTFKSKGYRTIDYEEEVPGTEANTTPIETKGNQNLCIKITVPPHLYNIQYSIFVWRDYFVRMIVKLPIPHKNVVLDIPVEIGLSDENIVENRSGRDVSYNDAPPSYWEAMGEAIEDNEYGIDNEFDNKKSEK